MLPSKERRNIVAFFLGKAKARYPGIQVACICQMSNHLHLVLRDRDSQLSGFMRDFLGHCAKALNRLDMVRGTVFERRYTAIPIVDMDAAVRRIAYAITNPVDAGLVRSHRDWTGFCDWFGAFEPETVTYFHAGKHNRAVKEAKRTGAPVSRKDFEEMVTLDLDAIDGLDSAAVKQAIEAREAELRPKHPRILGMRRVLQQSSFDCPKRSKRSAMPLCLYTCRRVKAVFERGWFSFLEKYREASAAFRAGDFDVSFPMFCFRPVTVRGLLPEQSVSLLFGAREHSSSGTGSLRPP